MPANDDDALPTTAYAVLSLLALRPWTGYELTQQAKRSLHFLWPKAESNLYAQPPRLVALGMARVEIEQAGGRTRNRYSITPAGRAALRRWLGTEPAVPRFEAEPALRVGFADLGAPEDAHHAIETLRQWARAQLDHGLTTMESIADRTAPFPQRDHVNVLLGHLFGRLSRVVLEWCDLADEEVHRWGSVDKPGSMARTTELLEELLQEGRELRATLGVHR